jgi:hypothetical protein
MNTRAMLLACLMTFTGSVPAGPPGPLEIESAPGNVRFVHQKHADTQCTVCHHTSPGIRIKRACRSCHMPASRMPRNSHAAFHEQCIGCHLDLKKAGKPGGPAKLCSQCHARY